MAHSGGLPTEESIKTTEKVFGCYLMGSLMRKML